jgi:hypothetical protein
MDMQTVLTHGLTYLAALALPLWLLGEQLLAWWTLRRPKVEKVEAKAHREVVKGAAETVRGAA